MGGWMAKNINSTKAVVGGVQSTKGRALAQNHLVSAHLTDYYVSINSFLEAASGWIDFERI